MKCLQLCMKAKFGQFHQMATVFKKIKQNPERKVKQIYLWDYYKSLKEQESASFLQIVKFVKDKPKINLSEQSFEKHFQGIQRKRQKQIQNIYSEHKLSQKRLHIEQMAKVISLACQESDLTLADVASFLDHFQKTTGKKSIQTKLMLIEQKMSKISAIESQYLIRILVGNLSIGINKKTINRLFFHKQQNILNQQQNQSVLQIDSNLSKQQKQRKLTKKFNMNRFQPMLCRALYKFQDFSEFLISKKSPFFADVKYDGERTIIFYERESQLQMYSRNNKSQIQFYKKFSQTILQQLNNIPQLVSIILDGQIVCVDEKEQPLPMQQLRKKRRLTKSWAKKSSEQKEGQQIKSKLLVFAFDVLEYNGQSLLDLTCEQRRSFLLKTQSVRQAEHYRFEYPQDKKKLLDYFTNTIDQGYEGLIFKSVHDKYDCKGSRTKWAKMKKGMRAFAPAQANNYDLDLIVMGGYYGKIQKNLICSYLLGIIHQGKIHPISKVGSGFTQESYQEVRNFMNDKTSQEPPQNYVIPKLIHPDVWYKPSAVFEIVCQQFTGSPVYEFAYAENYGGISLRFPIFKGIRFDKNVEQATDGETIKTILSSM